MPIIAQSTTINDLSVKPLWAELRSDGISTQGTNKASSKLTYFVPWEHRWTFLQEINGIFHGGTDQQVIRLPMQDEANPLLLVGSTGEVTGVGVGTKVPGWPNNPYVFNPSPYKYAKIPVTFATPEFVTNGDETLLQIDRDMAGEFRSLPLGFYKLDGVPGTQGVGKYVPCTAYSITRYRIPSFNDGLLDALRGKVNSTTFFGKAPGTVLFDGVKTSSSKDFGGVILNTASFVFLWKADLWNYGYSPLSGNLVPYDPPIYEEADHNQLFQ